MIPEDQMRRNIEIANRYYASFMKAAAQGFSQWRGLEPQLRRLTEEALKAADYPRLMIIRSFTFARGGWHDAPLLEMAAGELEGLVDDLVDKPDEEVKSALDGAIPAYFEDANDKYGAFKVGAHDDLVTALGLAVFRDPRERRQVRAYSTKEPFNSKAWRRGF